MFTGIIEATANVMERGDGKLSVERPRTFDDVKIGSSISVSGVCLTVTACDVRSLTFDTVPETIAKSTLGTLRPGDRVNLERALSASGRFEGHIVQGHGEGAGEVTEVRQREDGSREVTIEIPRELARRIVSKGSITVDGVSLTVAEMQDCSVRIALITHTLSSTTLGSLRAGDRVNIETDVLGRYVEKLLAAHPSS